MKKKFTAVDLFCGVGGVSHTLKKKFNILAAVEYDPIIAKSYKLNHGKKHLINKDIREISKDDWNKYINLLPGELDLLVSTPPCQGFSKHSRIKASENQDNRNNLIFETLKVSDMYFPKYILFENVDNIINFKLFHKFLILLVNLDLNGNPIESNRPSYHINFKVVDTSDYNVPQKRNRFILLAKRIYQFPFKDGVLSIPQKGHPSIKSPLNLWPKPKKALTLGKHLSKFKLNPIKAGETDPNDLLHTSRNLSEINLKRIQATPQNGGSRNSWPDELQLECHTKQNVSFGDVYGRMDNNKYAPTVTCGCISYSKGRFGHPTEDRAISLREAALIQTFPKSYKFTGSISGKPYEGSKDKMATQIGNAVPINLAKAFINEITKSLENEGL